VALEIGDLEAEIFDDLVEGFDIVGFGVKERNLD